MKTRCRHYSSPIHNACCKAEVNYRKLGDDSKPGYLIRLPCVVGSPLTKNPATCEKVSLLTEDELLKEEKEIEESGKHFSAAISEIRKKKLQSGHVECPKCKSNLNFSVAKSNGHIWAK